jgi:lysophospholipase L1-like esterase
LADAANGVPDKVALVACSGASTENFVTSRQHAGEPIGYPDGRRIAGFDDGLPQIQDYDWLWQHQAKPQPFVPKMVFVTIGANDAGFGGIGQTCVEPGNCAQIGQVFLNELAGVGTTSLLPAYDQIRKEFGGKAPIVVVPYAVPISDKTCRYSPLSADEHKFLNAYAFELDRMIERDAKAEGFYYVSNMPDALRGERICDVSPRKAGVNFVAANPVDGTAEETIDPSNWFHNSLHPNARGHVLLAAAVTAWINGHGNTALQPSPASPPAVQPKPFEARTLEDIMGPSFRSCRQPDPKLRPDLCARTSARWSDLHLRSMLASVSLPLLAVVAGSWLVWLVVLQRLRVLRAGRRARRIPVIPT